MYDAAAPGRVPLCRYSKGLQWCYSLNGSGSPGYEGYSLDMVACYVAESQRPGTKPVHVNFGQ